MSAVQREADRPLRIGLDMDGVLADFAGAFHEDIEERLFRSAPAPQPQTIPIVGRGATRRAIR